jgi:hypothetical protein
MTYRKYNTYGRLRTVMLGSYFYPEYFSKIKDAKIREPLMRVAQETNEDLDHFSNVLKEFGANVIKAPLNISFQYPLRKSLAGQYSVTLLNCVCG